MCLDGAGHIPCAGTSTGLGKANGTNWEKSGFFLSSHPAVGNHFAVKASPRQGKSSLVVWVRPESCHSLVLSFLNFILGKKKELSSFCDTLSPSPSWGSLNEVGVCTRPVLWTECGDWSKMLKGCNYGWSDWEFWFAQRKEQTQLFKAGLWAGETFVFLWWDQSENKLACLNPVIFISFQGLILISAGDLQWNPKVSGSIGHYPCYRAGLGFTALGFSKKKSAQVLAQLESPSLRDLTVVFYLLFISVS